MSKTKILFFVVSALFIASIPFVFDVYYATCDDPRYIGLVSGAYTGTPMKELVYVGSLLGFLESKLYSSFPGYEWYSIFYYFFTLFAFSTIMWQVLIGKFNRLQKKVLAVLVLVTQVYLSLTPQFTTLATQLSFASLVLLLSNNGGKKRCWLSLLLFLFATQVRLSAAFIPYMIACPLFFKDIEIKSSQWLKERVWLLGIFFVAIVSFGAEKYVYRTAEWKSFNAINDARGYMADNPMVMDYPQEIKDEEDRLAFDLYYRYRIFDLNILTPEKLEKYQLVFKKRAFESVLFNSCDYLKSYFKMGGLLAVLLVLWLSYELIHKRNWLVLFLCGLSLFMFLLASVNMMSASYAKERVLLCTFMTFLFSLLFFINSYSRYSHCIIVTVCIIFSVQYLRKDYLKIKRDFDSKLIVAETEDMIERVNASKVMVTSSVYLIPEAFHTSNSPMLSNTILHGWIHCYPKADLQCQPFTALVDGLPILVTKETTEQLEIIQKLLIMHYGVRTEQIVEAESEHYYLVKLKRKCNG